MKNLSEILRIADGHVAARILHTATELGVFGALEDGPLDADGVTERLGSHRANTEVFLDALVGMQMLRKDAGSYDISPAVRPFLLPGGESYMGDLIRFTSGNWDIWERLPEVIITGQSARAHDMFQSESEQLERFIMAMHNLVRARGDVEHLTQAVDFSSIRTMLDVGSGPASFPIGCCQRYPELAATVFDLPNTLEVTRKVLAREGLSERIALVAGDYRSDPISGRFDLVFLSNVIHAESAETNARLFEKLFANVADGGEIIIKDHILNEDRTAPANGAIFSVSMLLFTEGRDYTFEEVKGWLIAAGFRDVRRVPFGDPPHSALVRARR